MKYRLVKIEELSGDRASFYTILFENNTSTLFDTFLSLNKNSFKGEITEIIKRLKAMGAKTGARDHFFKKWEGRPGDGVAALYDIPHKKLRLYCIRYSNSIVILGSGGVKSVRTLQEDDILKSENYFLRQLSVEMTKRIREQEISYINDYRDFSGNLEFENHEDA